ncbi:acyltransferase family protein [Lonsdalea quercina]|uniref:acyltransferase family protein n=1 Tax=Lonsdalea quercina TaxID=71657 RepID=UPI003975E765
MLGIIRFFLASCVVAFHLTAKISFLGQFAVNFFYVISGFLITLILNDTYKFNITKFAVNRFLRLYPTYYFFAALGILIIYFMPNASEFHGSWSRHFNNGDWLGNLFIFPWAFLSDNAVPNTFGAFTSQYFLHVNANRFRIVTSSWSVAVEIICYFALWVFVSRNILLTIASLVMFSAYHLYVFCSFHDSTMAYYPFLAAMLPFSLGSLGFFIFSKLRENEKFISFTEDKKWIIAFFALAAFCLNWAIFIEAQKGGWHPFFYYTNNLLALIIVIALANTNPKGIKGKVTKILGDLSYPVFLCQYFGGYFAWIIVGSDKPNRGWDIFFIGYPISIIMALLCVWLIDDRVKKIRDKVRPSKRPV